MSKHKQRTTDHHAVHDIHSMEEKLSDVKIRRIDEISHENTAPG